MKFNIALSVAIIFCFTNLHSQDKIFKPDGSKLEVKILEISQSEIKYKKWSNQDGPIYTINKNDVMMILYQNGENEIINNSGVPNKNTSPLKQNEYGQNMFSFNPIHLIFGNITIAYEYFNLKGRSSFKFPLTIGYSNSNFNIGSEIKIFPNKQGKVRYFLGPIVKGGVLDYIKNNRIYNYKYFSFLFSNGGSFQPTKNFNITIDCGIGPGYLISNSNYSRGISFVNYQIGLSLGVRF